MRAIPYHMLGRVHSNIFQLSMGSRRCSRKNIMNHVQCQEKHHSGSNIFSVFAVAVFEYLIHILVRCCTCHDIAWYHLRRTCSYQKIAKKKETLPPKSSILYSGFSRKKNNKPFWTPHDHGNPLSLQKEGQPPQATSHGRHWAK